MRRREPDVRLAIDHGTGAAVLGVLFLASRTTPPWGGGSEWLWSRKEEALVSILWFQADPVEQLVGCGRPAVRPRAGLRDDARGPVAEHVHRRTAQ